jgi:hypothetical protein
MLIGAVSFVKAILRPENEYNLGVKGCLSTVSAAIVFTFALSFINVPLGLLGSVSYGVISWGPDAGFFLMLYSLSLAVTGAFLASKHAS